MLPFCGDALEYISKYTVQEYFRLETKVAVERIDNVYSAHVNSSLLDMLLLCVHFAATCIFQ